MSNEQSANLQFAGLSILVIEDDFYQADDTRRTLEDAGATIIGPFNNLPAGLQAIEANAPDYAVVDLNLGGGPAFEIPRELRARGVTVLIVSGYDGKAIPEDLRDLPRLEKPVSHDALTETLRAMLDQGRERSANG